MKKTNVILGIAIACFVICATIILILSAINNKEENNIPVNIDFTALSSEIEESTDFDSTKMQPITIEDLESEFGINKEMVKQVIGEKPYVNVSSNMYVIVEVTEGNVEEVTKAFEEYGKLYDDMWKNYLAEEYELVQNRLIGSKGNYVYFVVDDYAKNIVDLIK